MTNSQRRILGVVLLVVGALLVLIYLAAFLGWTPRLVHPWFMATLALAALFGGVIMNRGKDPSDP